MVIMVTLGTHAHTIDTQLHAPTMQTNTNLHTRCIYMAKPPISFPLLKKVFVTLDKLDALSSSSIEIFV